MKLEHPFLQLPLAFDAELLAREVDALGEAPWRPHPQGYPGNSALTLITTAGDPASDALGGAMRATPYLEQCPYLRQVLASLGATLGRTRLMRLSGQAEVSQHVDIAYYWREHMRVHVPILTQPTVRFHCGGDELNMAAGECWIFDTWRMHRVVNDAERPRIHLVVDTVGGEDFWKLYAAGRPARVDLPGWQAREVEPRVDPAIALAFEGVNVPDVMTPWEMRFHIDFLLGEAPSSPELQGVRSALEVLTRRWHALWARHGTARDGWPQYRALLNQFAAYIERMPAIHLHNTVVLATALRAIVWKNALADRQAGPAGAEVRQSPVPQPGRAIPGLWSSGTPH